jgi:hypothetical protein
MCPGDNYCVGVMDKDYMLLENFPIAKVKREL